MPDVPHRNALQTESALSPDGEETHKTPWYGVPPVSYTHLDVYKRQAVHLIAAKKQVLRALRKAVTTLGCGPL